MPPAESTASTDLPGTPGTGGMCPACSSGIARLCGLSSAAACRSSRCVDGSMLSCSSSRLTCCLPGTPVGTRCSALPPSTAALLSSRARATWGSSASCVSSPSVTPRCSHSSCRRPEPSTDEHMGAAAAVVAAAGPLPAAAVAAAGGGGSCNASWPHSSGWSIVGRMLQATTSARARRALPQPPALHGVTHSEAWPTRCTGAPSHQAPTDDSGTWTRSGGPRTPYKLLLLPLLLLLRPASHTCCVGTMMLQGSEVHFSVHVCACMRLGGMGTHVWPAAAAAVAAAADDVAACLIAMAWLCSLPFPLSALTVQTGPRQVHCCMAARNSERMVVRQ